MVPTVLGIDMGGSMRQPASFSSITRLKTTYGRVPGYRLIAYSSSFDSVGCFGRTAEDTAFLFRLAYAYQQVIDGYLRVPEI